MKFAKNAVCLLLILTLVSGVLPAFGEESVTVSYAFSTQLPGRADGTVTVTGVRADGVYGFAWGTADGPFWEYEPLAEATAVSISDTKLTYSPEPLTAIPVGATHLWLTENGLPVASAALPVERLASERTVNYTFGVISDLHFGSGNAPARFRAAMDYFDGAGVSFVATVGDNTCGGTAVEWNQFADTYEAYDVPLWLTLGNHDALAWNLAVTPNVAMKNVRQAFPYFGTETNPYGGDFRLNLSDRHPEYDYTVSFGDDLFLFMGVGAASNDSEDKNIDQRLSDGQLEWLEEELTAFYSAEDHGNAVLFFHYYTIEAGMKVREGTEWDKASSKKLHSLLNKFPGVIYFNGHNHHEFDAVLPLSYVGAYASVHVPSLGYGSGEGYLVEVCEGAVQVKGVDFATGKISSRASFDLSDEFSDPVKSYGVSLRTTATGSVQWRADANGSKWEKFTELSALKTDGTVTTLPCYKDNTVDFRASQTHIQWKLTGADDSAWEDLIELEDIPKGDSDGPAASDDASQSGQDETSGGGTMIWIAVAASAVILCAGALAVILILRKNRK